jgi:glycosyltransferase involved in cell wall biosynthesis
VLVDYARVGAGARPDPRVAAELAASKARGGADLLFVGRVVPSKAQHDLVKALWTYRRLYDPAARLHLVGGTSSFAYLKALRGFIGELGLADAVRMPGDVSDAALAAYFAAADVYLSLSAHEGFGVPLLEAMTAGVPVVTRRVGAVAETVGEAALLVDAGDPLYIAATLRRVCTDGELRRRLVAAGRQRLSAFSPEAVTPLVVAAVASVAGAPR